MDAIQPRSGAAAARNRRTRGGNFRRRGVGHRFRQADDFVERDGGGVACWSVLERAATSRAGARTRNLGAAAARAAGGVRWHLKGSRALVVLASEDIVIAGELRAIAANPAVLLRRNAPGPGGFAGGVGGGLGAGPGASQETCAGAGFLTRGGNSVVGQQGGERWPCRGWCR